MVDMFKRVFSRKQPDNVTKSIRCTLEMWTALTQLAEKAGETPNAYLVLVLDQYLQAQVELGNLKLPIALPDGEGSTVAS